MKRLAFLIGVMFCAGSASAHSGGTNSEGCHYKRATGEYHCHTPKGSRAKPKPKKRSKKRRSRRR